SVREAVRVFEEVMRGGQLGGLGLEGEVRELVGRIGRMEERLGVLERRLTLGGGKHGLQELD
ncbi:hypothetical protein M422DRAFT_267971, partial [Sphaerobolus stellatus SS14]